MWRGGSPGYTPPSPMSASFETEPGRLNGWKEIALHLGKGARTVQRWEKLYGLPVHRLGREGGEIVFAFRDEIDRWTASTERERAANGEEPPRGGLEAEAGSATDGLPIAEALEESSAPPRRRWITVGVVLLVVAAALATLSLRWRPAGHPGAVADAIRQPATWRMGNESLTVFDGAGSPLFEHRFDFSLQESTSSGTWPSSVGPPPVVIADVDGDGRSEVLVRPNAVERGERRLYCFEPDGRVRFVHQPLGTRRFGDDEYAEPWLAHRVFVTRGPAGAKRVWGIFTHNLLFPSVLRELDPRTGAVRQEYWSNGYIEVVHEEQLGRAFRRLRRGHQQRLPRGKPRRLPRGPGRGLDTRGALRLRLPGLRTGWPRGPFRLSDPVHHSRRRTGERLRGVGRERPARPRQRVTRSRGNLLRPRTPGGAADRRDLPRVPGRARPARAGACPRPPVWPGGRRATCCRCAAGTARASSTCQG